MSQSRLITFRNILLYLDARLNTIAEYGIPSWSRTKYVSVGPGLRSVVQFIVIYVVPIFIFLQGVYGLFADWNVLYTYLSLFFGPIYSFVAHFFPLVSALYLPLSQFAVILGEGLFPILSLIGSIFIPFQRLFLSVYKIVSNSYAVQSVASIYNVVISHGAAIVHEVVWAVSSVHSVFNSCFAVTYSVFLSVGQAMRGVLLVFFGPVVAVQDLLLRSCASVFGLCTSLLAPFVSVLVVALEGFQGVAGVVASLLQTTVKIAWAPFVAFYSFFQRNQQTLDTVASAAQQSAGQANRLRVVATEIKGHVQRVSNLGSKFWQVVKGFWGGIRKFFTRWDEHHPVQKLQRVIWSLQEVEKVAAADVVPRETSGSSPSLSFTQRPVRVRPRSMSDRRSHSPALTRTPPLATAHHRPRAVSSETSVPPVHLDPVGNSASGRDNPSSRTARFLVALVPAASTVVHYLVWFVAILCFPLVLAYAASLFKNAEDPAE